MKKLKKLIFLAFAIAVVLACSTLGQKWETVSEDGITVEMPGKPEKKSQNVPTGSGIATGQMLTLDKGAEAYILGYNEFPPSANLDIDPQILLKGASDGAVRSIDGHVTSQREVTSGSYPGTEIIGDGRKEGKEIEFTIRLFWAKPRLIQTIYVSEKGKGNKTNAMRFLDSLKIS
jgi:hypothetical protein